MNRAERRRQQKLAIKTAGPINRAQFSDRIPEREKDNNRASLQLAIQEHSAGQLPKAANICQQILIASPNDPVALHLLGVINHQLGKSDTAVKLITKSLSINPNYMEAYNSLGVTLQSLSRFNEAVNCFQKALSIEPDFAETHNNLGLALQNLGKLEKAVRSYQKALSINPNYAEAHYKLGNVLWDLGASKHDDVIDCYQKAISIKPDYAEAHSNLGAMYKELGQLNKAVISYQKALAIKPDYSETNYNLGVIRQAQGRINDAIECLKKADPNTTKSFISAILLGLYYRNSERDAFATLLDRIKKFQPFNFYAACVSAFTSQQWETENTYKFCNNPVNLVTTYDLLETGDISPDLMKGLETEVDNNKGNEKFAKGHLSGGFKSIGNLFEGGSPGIKTLEQKIRHCIGKFYDQHNDNQSLLFRERPEEYMLNGWYIRLLSSGEITAHVHQGWLSGVFYLRVPEDKNDNAGNIEFTLNGYDLLVIRDDFPRQVVTTKPGRLVLFPSSLPHRVMSFSENKERISIAFDIVPG